MPQNNSKVGKKQEENNKAKESKEKSIYVKVSDETRNIIDKYKGEGKTISSIIEEAINIYDKYGGIIDKFGNNLNEIEEAIKLLDKYKNPEKAEDKELWSRARDEMKMVLIGKTTFNQLIAAAEAPKESLDKPFKKNVAFDIILWYTGKPLKSLTLEEILNTIKKMWVVANYFYIIDIKKENENEYHLLFKHRQNKRFSNYWLGYFTELFSSEELAFKCSLEGQAFDETLSISIKVAPKK